MKDSILTSQTAYHFLSQSLSMFDQWAEEEINRICTLLSSNDRVLDFGCGYGRELPQIADNVQQLVAIDIDFNELAVARQTANNLTDGALINADGQSLPIASHTFDAVLLLGNTFGNLGIVQSTIISEIERVLVPAGQIYISVFSTEFHEQRYQAYLQMGYKTQYKDERIITFYGGYTTASYTPEDLQKIVNERQWHGSIQPINDLGWLLHVKDINTTTD